MQMNIHCSIGKQQGFTRSGGRVDGRVGEGGRGWVDGRVDGRENPSEMESK